LTMPASYQPVLITSICSAFLRSTVGPQPAVRRTIRLIADCRRSCGRNPIGKDSDTRVRSAADGMRTFYPAPQLSRLSPRFAAAPPPLESDGPDTRADPSRGDG